MWWWVAACTGSVTTHSDPTEILPTDGGTVEHTGHSGVAWWAHSGTAPHSETAWHTAEPPDPCIDPPPTTFVSHGILGQVRRTEEFAFDAVGGMVNAAENDGIYRTSYSGNPVLLAPYSSWEIAGVRVTPDGAALALCDEAAGQIVAVDLQTGGQRVMASGLPSPNSIGFDQRGWLYVAAFGQVTRYRGVGAPAELLLSRPGVDFDGIAFAPDDSAVYWNADSLGDIYVATMDAAGEVLDVRTPLRLQVTAELDGMTTDVCGNLYVIATNGQLRRIRTDHSQETLIAANGRYTTAISFGSGLGGFERDHLYMMDRSDGLLDLELGIEGRRDPHYPP
ncbi:MAG: SMP-30/gluconolactonase/LRE family protein [Myxococcales bacterium]|nr:SMP-30/gluconolactonase/LRE family protein [Myxococcales bacterium]